MSDPGYIVKSNPRRFSSTIILPFVALIIGGWMVVDNYLSQGPSIEITFASGEGLKAGETKVKRNSVDLGLVEQVYLDEYFEDVITVVSLEAGTEGLLRDDTQFWVVRPRVGSSGISGISTLLSGAYVELAPGDGQPGQREFRGLPDIPVTPNDAEGLHITVVADRARSLSVGSPVLYNGFDVGRVESVVFSPEDRKLRYGVFIDAPYDDLVTTNTRFWNASGVSVEANSEGVAVHTESLEAIISGGLTFGLPDATSHGGVVEAGSEFVLHASRSMINEQPYRFGREYIVLFNQSVRGLNPGAAVDYRGLRVGSVLSISFDLVSDANFALSAEGHALIPVLIRIDPGRLGDDTEAALTDVHQFMVAAVENGFRASLAPGNLLTGAQFIELDYHDAAEPAEIVEMGPYTVIPSARTGLGQIQKQVSAVLAKLEQLPIENTLTAATLALAEIESTAATARGALSELEQVLNDPKTQALPATLGETLDSLSKTLQGLSSESDLYKDLNRVILELQGTLRNTNRLTNTLDARPSAIVFSREANPDAIPDPNHD